MQSNTKFAFMDEALQFLSQEWAYAKLKPNTATIPIDDKALPETADNDPLTDRDSSIKIVITPSTPIVAAAKPTDRSVHQSEATTTANTSPPPTVPVPDLILPSETTPYDPKEFYKTGCIMAMLLNEHHPSTTAVASPQAPPPPPTSSDSTAAPRELIVTTTWKVADKEKDHAEKAAHRAWVKSGAAACAGLAASRWYKAVPAEKDKENKSEVVQKKKKKTVYAPRRVGYQSCNAPAACAGLAASRWCTV
ncbi:hypothetical protein N0V82_007528 [Gnomoniopsis sp. IMI 355080]|nr:hypothetical protein N0V82_007528 [Gnomoniopsis sp. IMI 355080]